MRKLCLKSSVSDNKEQAKYKSRLSIPIKINLNS